jgi:cell division inhibitor SepF
MANAMRKMAEYLGLVDGDEYTDGYSVVDEYADYEEQQSQSALRPVQQNLNYEAGYAAPVAAAAVAQGVMRSAGAQGDVYRITTLHPHTYNDARRIGEEFRNGTPVIMNLGDMDDADARRIVDFSAGLAFGLHGSIEKVAKGVFLLSPANVDIGAAARAQLREDPFFNQS